MSPPYPIAREHLRIRDPFILPHDGKYLMYAQANNRSGSHFHGVEVYTSEDLEWWSQPEPVLTIPDPRILRVWAPEVHRFGDSFHLLVTLTYPGSVSRRGDIHALGADWPDTHARGTWHFRADSPYGPFKAESGTLLTPPEDMALDGTLWHEDGEPWLVYCHEWVQMVDGLVMARRLDRELRPTSDQPVTLFRASDAPCAPVAPTKGKVTDGPFLFRMSTGGSLFMLWSTMDSAGIYVMLAAESPSGSIRGPWQRQHVLLHNNAGHGMVFTDQAGDLRIAVHQPNASPAERLHLLRVDTTGTLPRVVSEV